MNLRHCCTFLYKNSKACQLCLFLYSVLFIVYIVSARSKLVEEPKEWFGSELFSVDARCDITSNLKKSTFKFLSVVTSTSRSGAGGALGLGALQAAVERSNRRELLNAALGPVTRETPLLCVLATGYRPARLQRLLAAVARLRNVRSALLVVSHACYDERIDNLIRSFTACMVMQIYYPDSIQLNPISYPGSDYDDREGDRDARAAENKHHWWWTAHVLFEELPWARRHTAPTLFLNEDSYVLPDALHVLGLAHAALKQTPTAKLLSLSGPLAHWLEGAARLTVASWRPAYESGLALDRTSWLEVARQADRFCYYKDTSWSQSLLEALGPVGVVASAAPRVLSAGQLDKWRLVDAGLFPPRMQLVQLWGWQGPVLHLPRPQPPPRPTGGWDMGDVLLCLDHYTSTDTSDELSTTPPVFTVPSSQALSDNVTMRSST